MRLEKGAQGAVHYYSTYPQPPQAPAQDWLAGHHRAAAVPQHLRAVRAVAPPSMRGVVVPRWSPRGREGPPPPGPTLRYARSRQVRPKKGAEAGQINMDYGLPLAQWRSPGVSHCARRRALPPAGATLRTLKGGFGVRYTEEIVVVVVVAVVGVVVGGWWWWWWLVVAGGGWWWLVVAGGGWRLVVIG